ERADRRARPGRDHRGLDDVDLGENAERAEPVAAARERRTWQHLKPEDATVEVLRPLGVGGHDTLVLDTDHVRSRDRSNALSRGFQSHRCASCALPAAPGHY